MSGQGPFPNALAHRRLRFSRDGRSEASRMVPVECAVALSYNGSAQAVMMATPEDLEDFARGFTLTEGIAAPKDIESIEIIPRTIATGDVDLSDAGSARGGPRTAGVGAVEVAIWLKAAAASRLAERRRSMAGPVGCGLCGIEHLAEALRPPPKVAQDLRLTVDDIFQVAADLRRHQPLQDVTRAVHAAAFWQSGKGIVMSREDVGRHNALDKLVGGLIAAQMQHQPGAVVLTSRVSLDMVQKVARLGAPVLIAVSAPTTAALDLAESCGITVAALARGDGFEVFTHPQRILEPGEAFSQAAPSLDVGALQ